ncbi:hypothetical protein CsatA_006575 [Cannabis sativa]
MEVDQVPQLAKCRILAATLEENAHDWFTQLPEDVIEELIRRGKFDKYKKGEESHPRADDKGENQNASGSRTPRNILTIIGGPHIAGDSYKSQEQYAREAKEKSFTNVNNLSERPEKLFKKECDDITFMESDARWVHHPHSDALVIVANIGGDNVHRILVDSGSSVNLLNFQAFKQMGLQEKDLRPVTSSIYGFTGDIIALKGMIKLPITLGTARVRAKSMADFAVIDQYSAYNVVLYEESKQIRENATTQQSSSRKKGQ